MKYTTNSGVSQSKDVTGSKVGIIVSKLHLLDNQKVAGEPDFDGGTGELKLLTKTSKGIQGPWRIYCNLQGIQRIFHLFI